MLKKVGRGIIHLVFLHLSTFFLKLTISEFVLHVYAQQTILMFGCFVFLSKRKQSIYRNANDMFINATVTIPVRSEKKKNPSVCKGTVLTNVTIKHTLFPEKILSNS